MTDLVVTTPETQPRHPRGRRLIAIFIGGLELAALGYWGSMAASSDLLLLVFIGVTGAVGWLLSWRVPRNPIGWLLLAIAGLWLLALPLGYLGDAVRDTHPALAGVLLWYTGDDGWGWLPPMGLTFTQLLLLFPDGRLQSPRWRRFWLFTVMALALAIATFAMVEGDAEPGLPNPIGWISPDSPILIPVMLMLVAAFAGSAASLVVRYRGAGAVPRAQIKWVALAGGLVVGLYAMGLPYFLLIDPDGGILAIVILAAFSTIPLSIGVAVLKYRLYEIDRIVSRTVSYTIVTFVVISTYTVVVTLVARLLPESNTLAVAGATLTAAAVFRPVLGWVRERVDHRFNRARFNAEHEVEAFSARMRNLVDPGGVEADLMDVAQRTLQPTIVGLGTIGTGQ